MASVTAALHRADTVNYWADSKCAKAFWSQSELPVFQQLVADTIGLAAPQAGEHWLDLGCGGGTLTRAICDKTQDKIGSILGLDYSAINSTQYEKMAHERNAVGRIRFQCHDFSSGLGTLADQSFDHAISGLSISYAQHYDEARGEWTQHAYHHLLQEVARVLRPGGRFVFSVNVPDPSWWAVGFRSLVGGVVRSPDRLLFLKNSLRMMKYGKWLKQEARKGRFHYLPSHAITLKLQQAGFGVVSHTLSYARQAYIFHAVVDPAHDR